MHRRGARLERLVRSRHRDAALADGLDLVGPGIDEGHIVARTRQERSEVASDGSGADEEQLLAHVSPPVACMLRRHSAGSTAEFWERELSAPQAGSNASESLLQACPPVKRG